MLRFTQIGMKVGQEPSDLKTDAVRFELFLMDSRWPFFPGFWTQMAQNIRPISASTLDVEISDFRHRCWSSVQLKVLKIKDERWTMEN